MNGSPDLPRRAPPRGRAQQPALNGLDYLEVSDDQRTLTVYFLGKAPRELNAGATSASTGWRGRSAYRSTVLDGRAPPRGSRARRPLERHGRQAGRLLDLHAVPRRADERAADRRLCPASTPATRAWTSASRPICPSDLDCKHRRRRARRGAPPQPEIDYLAKDYASFRQLILDRLALSCPTGGSATCPTSASRSSSCWPTSATTSATTRTRSPPRPTWTRARQRISVRRHARLVDYVMHEGCNARALVCLETAERPRRSSWGRSIPGRTTSRAPSTACHGRSSTVPSPGTRCSNPSAAVRGTVWADRTTDRVLHLGEPGCCLPATRSGTLAATLTDGWASLLRDAAAEPLTAHARSTSAPVTCLVLRRSRARGPATPADADPRPPACGRLTAVSPGVDPLGTDEGQPVVEVTLGPEDALPFPLCLSSCGAGRLHLSSGQRRPRQRRPRRPRPLDGPSRSARSEPPRAGTACRRGPPRRCHVRLPCRSPPTPGRDAAHLPPAAPRRCRAGRRPARAGPDAALAAVALRQPAATPPVGERTWEPRRDLLGQRPG